jgi:uncharacterized protein YdeI (YjbR/CyaY-like superfamily)
MNARYFDSPAAFRAWLEKHHATAKELLVGFHKRHTGKPSMTWPESVDEALCFGWIDGIRKSVDEERYTIRFTPRKPKSNWSNVNVRRVGELTELGRMTPAGRRVFEERDAKREYSYEETRRREFSPEIEKKFRAKKKAWAFFEAQPPGYRRTITFYVMSAKKEETRLSRLNRVIDASAAGRRIGDAFTVRKVAKSQSRKVAKKKP